MENKIVTTSLVPILTSCYSPCISVFLWEGKSINPREEQLGSSIIASTSRGFFLRQKTVAVVDKASQEWTQGDTKPEWVYGEQRLKKWGMWVHPQTRSTWLAWKKKEDFYHYSTFCFRSLSICINISII